MKRIGRGIRRVAGRMNKIEARYAEYLKQQQFAGYVEWFAYEPIKIKLADKTYWTPDFVVMRPDGILEAHDTKGTTTRRDSANRKYKGPWVEQHAAVKIKVAPVAFPIRVFTVWLDAGVWQYQEYGTCPAT